MTLKEQIAWALVDKDKYDFVTAMGIASNFIAEVKERPAGIYAYHGKNVTIRVKRT